jgi:hypothetical protein
VYFWQPTKPRITARFPVISTRKKSTTHSARRFLCTLTNHTRLLSSSSTCELAWLLPPLATPPSHEPTATIASGHPRRRIRPPPQHPSTSLLLGLSCSCDVDAEVTLRRSSNAVVSLLVRCCHLHLHRHYHPSRRSRHFISFVVVVSRSARV